MPAPVTEAWKTTVLPGHTVADAVEMLIAGTISGSTMTVCAVPVTTGFATHARELVINTRTMSPPASELEVNVALFVPALIPLTCQ